MDFLGMLKKKLMTTNADGKSALSDTGKDFVSKLQGGSAAPEPKDNSGIYAGARQKSAQNKMASANLYASDETMKTNVKPAGKDMESFADAILKSKYKRARK